jgi:hypothetical protein
MTSALCELPAEAYAPFAARLAALFDDMDRGYRRVAERSGFACNGCVDNCCKTRFHHHTCVEYLYLRKGFFELAPDQRRLLRDRAAKEPDRAGRPPGVMCPANVAQRCILYPYRPMICRLHGVPYRLRHPNGRSHSGPGCGEFHRSCEAAGKLGLDRTGVYTAMAQLEAQFRTAAGISGKIKMTVAGMIRTYDEIS